MGKNRGLEKVESELLVAIFLIICLWIMLIPILIRVGEVDKKMDFYLAQHRAFWEDSIIYDEGDPESMPIVIDSKKTWLDVYRENNGGE